VCEGVQSPDSLNGAQLDGNIFLPEHSSFTTVHSDLADRLFTEPERLHCGLLSQEVDNEELWAVYHSVKKFDFP
jgi:hypothetical protein